MNENDVKKWLVYAKSNLTKADKKRKPKNILYEDLCFDCQQCTEKSLKALLIFYNLKFPNTHSINLLIDLLKSNNIFIPDFVKDGVVLNEYAVITRYPGNYQKVERKDFIEALNVSKKIFEWAVDIVNMKTLFE